MPPTTQPGSPTPAPAGHQRPATNGRRDPLRSGLVRSLVLHGLVIGGTLASGILPFSDREPMGDPNALLGGGVAITPVAKIPIPARVAEKTSVADDVESDLARTKPDEKNLEKQEKLDREAIELANERARKEMADRQAKQSKVDDDYKPDFLRSNAGRTAVSPMFAVQGSGGVGVGTGTPLGSRFGAYADLIKRRVAEKWRTNDVSGAVRNGVQVIVTFDIQRDGSARNIQVEKASGDLTLDYSTKRAILEAAPFPPLPAEFDRSSAHVEFVFQLQR